MTEHMPSCLLRPLLSLEQPWGRRTGARGLEGTESWAQGSRAPSRGLRGSEISVPGEPATFIVPHPSGH